MKHPPYHLRPNKAVDRFLFIELLDILISKTLRTQVFKYTYYGFGGPFLDDFRNMHQAFPGLKMVCIDKDIETCKRQKFNKPNKKISIVNSEFNDFIASHDITNDNIFWLDFTGLKPGHFEDFQAVLNTAGHYTIIKITLDARSKGFDISEEGEKQREAYIQQFAEKYNDFYPAGVTEADFRKANFPILSQKMLEIAAERILDDPEESIFQPVASFVYEDGAQMMTLTGIILPTADRNQFIRELNKNKWKYLSLEWDKNKKIMVPTLSIKERLALDQILPNMNGSIKLLKKRLNFEVGKNGNESDLLLGQYADFYRFYPYFTKVVL
jgi:hypothetical protein